MQERFWVLKITALPPLSAVIAIDMVSNSVGLVSSIYLHYSSLSIFMHPLKQTDFFLAILLSLFADLNS